MKKIYVSPVSEIYDAEMGEMICGASKYNSNGIVGSGGTDEHDIEDPNGEGGGPGFGQVVTTPDGPGSSAKEFNLWGDW